MPSRRNPRAVLLPRLARLVQRAPAPLVLGMRPLLRGALALTPGLGVRVAEAMNAALGPAQRSGEVRAYFHHVADLIAFSALVYRSGITAPQLETQYVHDAGARQLYHHVLEEGKGALMVCPHLVGHEIMAGTATREVPVTVLVRRSPEPEYEAVKQRWYAAIGVEVVYREQKGSQLQGLGDVTAALRALRKKRVLAITPDLVQKPGTGISVRLFGRDVELPAGAFFLSTRAGAPLLPSFFHWEDGRYRLWCREPLRAPEGAERDEAVAQLAQSWATEFETFVREHPDMWQFWLDKRWRKWLGLAK